MIFQAHKGVSTENPENTMPAFEAAARQGYKIIELDVSVTKDLQFVLLHDATINRTARHGDGTPLAEPVNIGDITYAQALEYDFGLWFSESFKGTKMPLFETVLLFAKEAGVKLKIDNKYQRFDSTQRAAFFELLKPYEDVASLTCSSVEEMGLAHSVFPKMYFHYDGPVSEEALEQLAVFLPKEQLAVWLPHQNPRTAWVKVAFADARLAALVKRYARLGVWILSTEEQLAEAEALGAEIIETNGQLKPYKENVQ